MRRPENPKSRFHSPRLGRLQTSPTIQHARRFPFALPLSLSYSQLQLQCVARASLQPSSSPPRHFPSFRTLSRFLTCYNHFHIFPFGKSLAPCVLGSGTLAMQRWSGVVLVATHSPLRDQARPRRMLVNGNKEQKAERQTDGDASGTIARINERPGNLEIILITLLPY